MPKLLVIYGSVCGERNKGAPSPLICSFLICHKLKNQLQERSQILICDLLSWWETITCTDPTFGFGYDTCVVIVSPQAAKETRGQGEPTRSRFKHTRHSSTTCALHGANSRVGKESQRFREEVEAEPRQESPTIESRDLANGWTHPSFMSMSAHLFISAIQKVVIVT